MNRYIRFFPYFALMFVACGGSDLYMDDMTFVDLRQVPVTEKTSQHIELEYLSSPNICVVDTLLVGYNVKPIDNGFFSVYDLERQERLGSFCPQGRGIREVIAFMLLRQIDRNQAGELVADLYAYNNNSLLTWNITKSLAANKTVYDKIVPVDWKQCYNSVCRYNFRVNDDLKILHVPTSMSETNRFSPMHYSLYSIAENRELKSIRILEKPLISKTPHYSTEMLSYTEDCLKPDKTKIAFGMTYAPVFGIVDIVSGAVDVFSLDRSFRFSDLMNGNTPVWHFKNLQADDNRIYALYHGDFEPRTGKVRQHDKSMVYVFDWQGCLKERLMLDHEVYCIALDSANSCLYGVDPGSETLYKYRL